jgi:hypothetical protein
MRNIGFFMHNRGRYFVQQLKGGANLQPSWNFVAPSTNNGAIETMISDGADGWYVGGSFTSITDSVATYTTGYTRLVRLRADGTIDTAFSCPVGSSTINAMALDSTGLYIVGSFSGSNSVGTSTRNRIARVRPFNDPSPGAVDAWNPGCSGSVAVLALDSANGKFYIGGGFTSIGGSGTDNNPSVPRSRIARLSTGATGVVDVWNPNVPDVVRALALDAANGKLYVGGDFSSVGGTGFDINPAETRRGICRLTTGTNATLDVWNPNVVVSASLYVQGMLYDAVNGKLYIGGTFTSIGASSGVDIIPATTRNRIARLTTGTNASLDAWNPNAGGTSTTVQVILHDTANGFIYLGGSFTTIGGTGRNRIARVSDGATATLDGWDPNVSIAAGTAVIRAILLYPVLGKAIIAGQFDAIVNQVNSLGNDVAGLDT